MSDSDNNNEVVIELKQLDVTDSDKDRDNDTTKDEKDKAKEPTSSDTKSDTDEVKQSGTTKRKGSKWLPPLGSANNKKDEDDDDEPEGGLLNEATDKMDDEIHWKRRTYRVIVLVVTLILIIGIVIVINITIVNSDSKRLGNSLEGKRLIFDVDHCNLVFEHHNKKYFQVNIQTEVDLHLKVNIENGPSDVMINVTNHRLQYKMYSRYHCDVQLLIPKGAILPDTFIFADGRLLTTVVGYNINWGTNSLTLESKVPDTQMHVYLEKCSVGKLTMNVQTGTFRFLHMNLTTTDFNDITTVDGNIFITTQQSVAIETNRDPSALCLNAYALDDSCDEISNCSRIALHASAADEDPSDFPTYGVQCSSCYLHLIAQDDEVTNEEMSTFGGVNDQGNVVDAGFSAVAVKRIQETFATLPTRDVVFMNIIGAGLPSGRFIWSSRLLYMVFHPAYLDVSTFYLLSPRTSSVNITLSPAFCPGLTNSIDLDHFVRMDNLLKSIVTPVPNPDSIFSFQVLKEISADIYRIKRDSISGEYYFFAPGFTNSPRLLTILIVNILLTFLTATYLTYMAFNRLNRWRGKVVNRWGKLYFGDKWAENKEDILNRAGPIFLSEFIIGFPKQRRGYWKMTLTVWLHILILACIVAPLLACSIIWQVSVNHHQARFPLLSYIGYVISLIYGVLSILHLTLYYLELPWQIRKFVAFPLYAVLSLTAYCSCLYLCNVAYWILLGALIRPNDILPYASVVVVVAIHGAGTATRVSTLAKEIREKSKSVAKGQAQPEKVEFKYSGKFEVAVREGISLLKKKQLFEIGDLTLRQQIVKEIVLFVLMLFFFLFILVGFTTLSSSQDLATAISTVLIFVVGGGVNIPLGKSEKDAEVDWEKQIVKQAKRNQRKKEKGE